MQGFWNHITVSEVSAQAYLHSIRLLASDLRHALCFVLKKRLFSRFSLEGGKRAEGDLLGGVRVPDQRH